ASLSRLIPCFLFLMFLRPPVSTLFPYTTLFRSDLMPFARARMKLRGAIVSNPAHDIDRLDEDVLRMPRHPIARRMVDRVARSTADAEELDLRLLEIADAADVLVAVAIDLGGAHHHMALPPPEHIENLAEGDPALDDLIGIRHTVRSRVREDLIESIRENELGRIEFLRDARADRRSRSHRAHHVLAVIAEAICYRDDADTALHRLS